MQSDRLKLVFITDGDIVNRWVLDQVGEVFPPQHLFVAQWSGKRIGLFQQLGKALQISNLMRLGDKLMLGRLEKRREKYMAERFGKEEARSATWQVSHVEATRFNQQATADAIRAIEPDLIIVCGGPILKASIFSIPRLGTVNLHFGISSAYRGQHTIFWPLKECDFEKIGATIHRVDAGVDTGNVLFEVYPTLHPEDDEFSIEESIARELAKALIEFLHEIESSNLSQIGGRKLGALAQQIYYRQRTLWVETKYRLQRRLGKINPPRRDARVVRLMNNDSS